MFSSSVKIIKNISNMHLYLDAYGPPCRAVAMVATMTGSKVERHYLDLLANNQFSEDYLKINPLHKVPFLVDGDLKLGESRTIMRYLADKDLPQDNTLYPHDLKLRAQVNEILDLDSGTFYTLVYELFRPKFFGLAEKLDKELEAQFKELLEYLVDRLEQNGGEKFLLGDHVTLADIAIVATLSLADICDYDLSMFPKLVEYLQRLESSIPEYKKINQEGVERYRNFVRLMN